jgi:uroporphyrinogen-III synthase
VIMSLAGKKVALAEGRQLEELVSLLEKEKAVPIRCPLLSILDSPDTQAVAEWLEKLRAGHFSWLILLTGEGLRRLLAFSDRQGLRQQTIEAIAQLHTLTRGPKPMLALKEIGLKPTRVAAAPTTQGVIQTLQELELKGQSIGVQLYSESNPPLQEFLTSIEADAHYVSPYIYAPASDADKVAELIQQMATGQIDVLVFTSAPQVERLWEVAEEKGLVPLLGEGIRQVKVASVGPVVSENLRNRGVTISIQPEQGFQMKNLVVHIRRAFE